MIKTTITVAMLGLGLAACGQNEVALKNASVEDVAKVAKNAKMLDPGKWAITTEVKSVDMPGMSAENKLAADQMSKAMMGKPTTIESCITPEMANAPTANMLAGEGSGDCQFDSFKMASGTMDSVMTCKQPGGEISIAMKGTYSGSAYSATTAMTMEGGPHGGIKGMGGKMTVTAATSAKRIGECSAADRKQGV